MPLLAVLTVLSATGIYWTATGWAQTVAAPVTPINKGTVAVNPTPTGGVTWKQLTSSQRRALAPLSETWNTLSEVQKSKWLALSQNFAKLSESEQAKLHDRMSDWALLSPQQRTQARLNFAEAKDLTAEEKEARWQAYQALSSEEKKELARSATTGFKGAATAVKPVPAYKLATTPSRAPASMPAGDVTSPVRPRVLLGTSQLNQNTLLPKSAVSAPQRP